ncbi:MAG: hypothetical protein AAB371_01020 [Patescibacteria group bacterium]
MQNRDRDMRGGGFAPRSFKPRDGEVWSCAKCNGEIESLPFDPRRNPDGSLQSPVYHRDCLPPRTR